MLRIWRDVVILYTFFQLSHIIFLSISFSNGHDGSNHHCHKHDQPQTDAEHRPQEIGMLDLAETGLG